MPFGYVPHQNSWKNLILKVLGHPNLIRRIQAPVLMRMLETKKDDIILDAGCGSGFFSYEIAKRCKTAVGIDWNLNISRSSWAMRKQPNVAYVIGDVQKLPFADEKFDKILLSSVLQMVEDDETLLKECHRVLKKKGTLVLSVIEYIHIKRLNYYKSQLKEKFGARGKAYYDYDEVIGLLQGNGFEIIEVEYSPKKWGSLIFESYLFLWYRFNFPSFSPLLFPLLYPIAYFDKFANNRQKGNELIIKAKKVN